MADIAAIYRDYFDVAVDRTTERLIRDSRGMYGSLTHAELRPRVVVGLKELLRDLSEQDPHYFGDFWARISYDRARQGYRIDDMQLAVTIAEKVAREIFIEQITDPDERLAAVERLMEIITQARVALSDAFINASEEVIHEQAAIVEELSSPIIPIYEGIVVLTLVGSVDSRRASQIMEGLLSGITENQASVVIIDITGVPVIDTGVANYLLQAARAARLLGAQVMLVGIGPEIAQTIVQLGIDLRDITTSANLQAGLEYALDTLGLEIVPRRR